MRNLLLLCALLFVFAVRAGDHRVCTYRGAVIGTTQPAGATLPVRVSMRGWLIVDWTDTAGDLGGGWTTLSRVTFIGAATDGTVTRVDYTADDDLAKPPFALVPQPDDSRGLLVSTRSETGWEALMLEGANFDFTMGDTPWHVPLRLMGRYLAYTADGEAAAVNARYVLSLDRVHTLLTAQTADGDEAFLAAVAAAETAAHR